MKTMPFSLAEIDVKDALNGLGSTGGFRHDYLIILGALLLVSLLALFWAVFIRKPGRRHRSRHVARWRAGHATPTGAAKINLPEGATGEKPVTTVHHRRHHRRRAHREHRLRNPTLAETGGLPPVRSGGPGESPR